MPVKSSLIAQMAHYGFEQHANLRTGLVNLKTARQIFCSLLLILSLCKCVSLKNRCALLFPRHSTIPSTTVSWIVCPTLGWGESSCSGSASSCPADSRRWCCWMHLCVFSFGPWNTDCHRDQHRRSPPSCSTSIWELCERVRTRLYMRLPSEPRKVVEGCGCGLEEVGDWMRVNAEIKFQQDGGIVGGTRFDSGKLARHWRWPRLHSLWRIVCAVCKSPGLALAAG